MFTAPFHFISFSVGAWFTSSFSRNLRTGLYWLWCYEKLHVGGRRGEWIDLVRNSFSNVAQQSLCGEKREGKMKKSLSALTDSIMASFMKGGKKRIRKACDVKLELKKVFVSCLFMYARSSVRVLLSPCRSPVSFCLAEVQGSVTERHACDARQPHALTPSISAWRSKHSFL